MLPRMALTEYVPRVRGTQAPTHDFRMFFLRDGVEEPHEFTAQPSMGWADVKGLTPLVGGRTDDAVSAQAIGVIDRMIRRSLINTDGVPEKWTPEIVDGHFTDPHGDHVPEDLLPAYTAFAAGSSRRRWVALMEHDDDVTVEADQIVALLADLMEVTAARPTTRSAPSSR